MNFSRFSLGLLAGTMLLASCVKKTYDSPLDTSQVDPKLPVQLSLKNLSLMGQNLGSGKWRQLGDTTIYGVVVADDRSGNYYKQIVIEDTTFGGIVLYLDKTYLYADYPVGRGVYVKLKGLYLMNYKGLPEIVYTVDAGGNTTAIPSGLIDNYVVRGKFPDNSVSSQDVQIVDVKLNASKYLSTLVNITDAQFATGSNGVSYALPSAVASGTDRILTPCDGSSTITLRTSGYSTLQPYITPNGHGSIKCIVSTYAGAPQMILRDTTDVNMIGARCN